MPRLPDCRIVGKELTFVFPSNGDALVGYRMIRDAVDAAEKAVAPPKPKPPLQLRIGGWWRDGEGHEWEVFAYNRKSLYPFYARRDGGKHVGQFSAVGKWSVNIPSTFDLIEEIAPAPKTAPKPALQLRVGAHYRRSDGMTGRVVFRSAVAGYFLWEGTDGLRRAYNEDGTARHQFEGVKNLIEEIAPPPCPTRHDCRAGQTERCTCCDKEG